MTQTGIKADKRRSPRRALLRPMAGDGWKWCFGQSSPCWGVVLIIAGVPIAIATPLIPVGLPITILGVVLLARNSMAGRRWMQRTLKRHPRLERFAPDWLLRLILGKEGGA